MDASRSPAGVPAQRSRTCRSEYCRGICQRCHNPLNAFVIQAPVGETVQGLLDLGQHPPVWTSANIPGGDDANSALIARYAPRIRWL